MTHFAALPAGTPARAQTVPSVRLRELGAAAPNADGDFVLYWMIGARRPGSNFALQHARDVARALGRPLLVLEALRLDYRWASERLHRFVIEGMAHNAAAFAGGPARYAAYLEPEVGAGRGLIEALAERACAVITDDCPVFFLGRAVEALAPRLRVPLVAVDGNGLLPLRRAPRAHKTARGFRRALHDHAAECFAQWPARDPLARVALPALPALPAPLRGRFPALDPRALRDPQALIDALEIDRAVASAPVPGGAAAAQARLQTFARCDLARYGTGRNHPDDDASSGLSPYLHFGHIGAHQVIDGLGLGLDPERFDARCAGKRAGFWGAPEGVEAFLDELLTWRELAQNGAAFLRDHDRYRSLPPWARATLAKHASDPRPERYELDRLAAAQTGDALWNAAQRQLLREGRMHNYLRMLWGKRILEWSATPEQAFEHMVELNNRYALDGRDPSSYAGIAWVLGRYDRAWGPERPIFGTVRYMSSESTRRKLRLRGYLERYAA